MQKQRQTLSARKVESL